MLRQKFEQLHLQKQHLDEKYKNRIGYIGVIDIPSPMSSSESREDSFYAIRGSFPKGKIELKRIGPLPSGDAVAAGMAKVGSGDTRSAVEKYQIFLCGVVAGGVVTPT